MRPGCGRRVPAAHRNVDGGAPRHTPCSTRRGEGRLARRRGTRAHGLHRRWAKPGGRAGDGPGGAGGGARSHGAGSGPGHGRLPAHGAADPSSPSAGALHSGAGDRHRRSAGAAPGDPDQPAGRSHRAHRRAAHRNLGARREPPLGPSAHPVALAGPPSGRRSPRRARRADGALPLRPRGARGCRPGAPHGDLSRIPPAGAAAPGDGPSGVVGPTVTVKKRVVWPHGTPVRPGASYAVWTAPRQRSMTVSFRCSRGRLRRRPGPRRCAAAGPAPGPGALSRRRGRVPR